MEPTNSNHELIRRGLSLLTKGLRPFIEREMRNIYGEDWDLEARSALQTPPDVPLHWDSQAALNVIDRRWREVFRRKLERKHRSWAIEAVSLRNDLMHEKKQSFSDKETMRGLDTIECLLAAVSAPESREVALLKDEINAKQKIKKTRGTGNTTVALTPDEIIEKIGEKSPKEAEIAQQILDWSRQHCTEQYCTSEGFSPVFEHDFRPVGIGVYGRLWIHFGSIQKTKPFDVAENRLEFRNRLNGIPGVTLTDKKVYPSTKLSALASSDALEEFKGVIIWAMNEVKNAHQRGPAKVPSGSQHPVP